MASPSLKSQIVNFLISGGIAALANAGVGVVLRLVLFGNVGYAVSVVAGFATGTVVSFVLNRAITFKATAGRLSDQVVRYTAAAIVGMGIAALLASLLLFAFRAFLHQRFADSTLETLAHAGAIGLTTVYNFAAIKYFALRVSASDAREAAGPSASA